MAKTNTVIEFVDYTGSFPCLCYGNLTLRINGEERTLTDDDGFHMWPGGSVSFDEDCLEIVTTGPWSVSLPNDLEQYHEEIEALVNENVSYGCCGGCV